MDQHNEQNNQDLNVVEKATNSNDAPSATLDKFSIFNYLKNHPAAILACFSSMVAIITFMSQFLTYISSKNTLEYWNFDVSYASFHNNGLLYSAIASVVYLIIMPFATTWFLKTSEVYIERKKYYLIPMLICRQQNRICKNQKKQLKKLRCSPYADQNEISRIEKSVQQTQRELKDIKRETRKERNNAHLFFWINVLPIMILACFLAFVISFMTIPKGGVLISTLVVLFIHIVAYFFLFVWDSNAQIKRRKMAKDISNKEIQDILDEHSCKKDYPLWALFIKGDGISNYMIITQIIIIALVFIILIFTYGMGLTNTQQTKKEFQITNIDGIQYAIVYYSDNTYYLTKADIDEETLTIYTEEQRIISTSDISFSVQTFDKVMKVEETEEVEEEKEEEESQ